MQQMKLFFPSGAELDFAGQFHGEYVHLEADLLLPITQHCQKPTQECPALRLKATGFISK